MNLRETRLLLERPRIECGKQGFYMKRGLRSEKMIVLLLTSNIWASFGNLHASFLALGLLCLSLAACCCSGTKSYDKILYSHYSSTKMFTPN